MPLLSCTTEHDPDQTDRPAVALRLDFRNYVLEIPMHRHRKGQLVLALEDYLRTVQAGRGIRSFRVVCDDTNNPPALVNSGVLAIAVVIVPILAVREIQMTLVISKEGLEVTEEIIASL